MLRRILLTVLFGLSYFTACAAAEAVFYSSSSGRSAGPNGRT